MEIHLYREPWSGRESWEDLRYRDLGRVCVTLGLVSLSVSVASSTLFVVAVSLLIR